MAEVRMFCGVVGCEDLHMNRILGASSAIMGTLAGVFIAISAISDHPMLMVAAVVLILASAGALIATGIATQAAITKSGTPSSR